MATEQELMEMERMSNDYVPDAKGPLVGEQQSTQALVAEYAQADPIYVHKTTALPSTFSHYRTVRGDGNCGWRALAFGYFEALLRIGKSDRIRSEITKISDYNKIFDDLGNDRMLYEDFVDATLDLLEKTARSLSNHDGRRIILEAFNNDENSNAIVYHFRMIASAWLRSHADHYSMFLPGGDVEAYCQHNIDPFAVELEHIGLQGLATALINEAGMDIEVLYLDRSTGTEVTQHRAPVLDASGLEVESLSTIRLLYRPGHYDLLYKTEDMVKMSISALASPEIRLVSNQPDFLATDNFFYSHNDDSDPLQDVPGYSLAFNPCDLAPVPYQSPRKTLAAPKPQSPTPKKKIFPPTTVHEAPPRSKALPVQLKIRPHFTQFVFDFDFDHVADTEAIVHEEGSPDLSKREDPAHYLNEIFQPQMWRPGKEYERQWDKEDSSKSSS